MAFYLLIESRDPFECQDVNYYYDLADSCRSDTHILAVVLCYFGHNQFTCQGRNATIKRI